MLGLSRFSLGLGLAPLPVRQAGDWILAAGAWNDGGTWIDSETWNDS
jgi:hypothetical protein